MAPNAGAARRCGNDIEDGEAARLRELSAALRSGLEKRRARTVIGAVSAGKEPESADRRGLGLRSVEGAGVASSWASWPAALSTSFTG